MERPSLFQRYMPLFVQTVMLMAAGWGYASTSEHRLTVLEEMIKMNQGTIQQLAQTQRDMGEQLRQLEKIVNTQVVLEDYVHRVKGAQ